MAISNAVKAKVNKMNRAAKDAQLGDRIAGISGSAAVTTAQMSASAVIVYSALATGGGFMYQVTRSGSPLSELGFYGLRSGGSLTVKPINSGSFTVGDVVTYLLV
jgi:hypothetical protein